jgi:hypothetical protein
VGTIVSKRDLLRAVALGEGMDDAASVSAAAQLARSLSGPELQALALFTAQRTEREVHPIFSFHATRMIHPWRLLSLWLYASVRSLSEPRDVLELTIYDPNARELLRGELVSEEVLGRFYARNEEVIVACVGELLRAVRDSRRVLPKNF